MLASQIVAARPGRIVAAEVMQAAVSLTSSSNLTWNPTSSHIWNNHIYYSLSHNCVYNVTWLQIDTKELMLGFAMSAACCSISVGGTHDG